jgi:hypothetical protein
MSLTMIKPTICSDTHDDPEVVQLLKAQLLDGMTAAGLPSPEVAALVEDGQHAA